MILGNTILGNIYKSALENMNEAVYIRDLDKNIIYMNPASEALTGWSFKEARGKKCREVFGDGTEDCPEKGLHLRENRLNARSGEVRQVLQSTSPLYRGKTVNGAIVVLRDITPPGDLTGDNVPPLLALQNEIRQRRTAEDALVNSENLLSEVFESIKDGITVMDTDLTIRRVNGIMKGWYPQKLPLEGKTCYECFHGSSKPCDPCPAVRCIKSGKTEKEIVPGLPGSSLEWIELFSYPIKDPDSGEITGIVELVRDITQRRLDEEKRLKLEAQFQQAQKFESLNVMAGSIAHSFNNLLMIVLGNLELAQWDRGEGAAGNEHILNARKAAKRAADLSTLMLTYVGQSRTEPETVDLTRLLEDMTGTLEALTAKNVSLIIKPARKSLMVKCDPDQVRRILRNLVTNAVEAVGENQGTVSVSTGTMFCQTSFLQQTVSGEDLDEGDYVFIEVSDNGCGMDDETRQKIFDPFFTTRETGRGLGLSTVLGFVRGNKGAIYVDTQSTEPRKGTTIRVLFPNLETTPKETPREAPKKVPVKVPENIPERVHKSERQRKQEIVYTVLVVDEDETVLELGKDMLEELGFNALTALNGREAVEIFEHRKKDINCIMLDMNLPDIGVDHALMEIKRIDPDIPVIISSGYADNNMKKQLQSLPVAGFLQKPYTLSKLSSGFKKLFGL